MINLRGLGNIDHHRNIKGSKEASEAAGIEKRKKELQDALKKLTPRQARKYLEEEYGRDIDDPAEKEIIELLTEEIKNKADKFSS